MMGVVLSNCRTRCVADTPSRLGIMISIRTRSYFAPELSLLTASRPSSFETLAKYVGASTCCRTYSAIDRTMEGKEKLPSNASAGLVVFHEENLGLANPARVHLSALLALFRLWCRLEVSVCSFRWQWIWDIVDVFAVHGIDSLCVANRIYQRVEIVACRTGGGR